MRILLINDFLHYSGAERIVNSIARIAKAKGHEVVLLTHENFSQLRKIVSFFKPDIINQHNFSLLGPEAFKISGIPFLQTIHDYWPVCKNRHRFRYDKNSICSKPECSKCRAMLGKLPFPEVSLKLLENVKISVVSDYMRRILEDFGYRNVEVILNGIEISTLPPKDLNFIFCTAKNPPEIKGSRIFAEIAKGLPYKFVLSGTTPQPGVTNLGFLPREELMNLFKNCSIFVMPSIWEEPCGLTNLEAMQFGKPIIAFKTGGIPEYVENFTLPLGDIEACRKLIVELMENPSFRKEKGEANRKRLKNEFSAEKMTERYLKLYERIIKEFES